MGRLKELPDSERPRERLVHAGARALSDTEIVAVLLGGGLEAAEALVARTGGAAGLATSTVAELRAVRGIGDARACQLVAAVELGRRASLPPLVPRRRIQGVDDAVAVFADMATLDLEELHAASLDGRNAVIARHVVARGARNVIHVEPRDLLRTMLRDGAAAFIVAHNHPSGDVTPSAEDVLLTKRIVAAGKLVGMRLVDHLVVATGRYHSFADTDRGME